MVPSLPRRRMQLPPYQVISMRRFCQTRGGGAAAQWGAPGSEGGRGNRDQMALGSTSHKLRDACEGPRREMVKKRIRSGGPSADGCENGRAVRRPVRLLLLAFSVLLGACSATAPSPSPLSTSVPTLAPTEGPTPTPALSPGSYGRALDLAMAAPLAE